MWIKKQHKNNKVLNVLEVYFARKARPSMKFWEQSLKIISQLYGTIGTILRDLVYRQVSRKFVKLELILWNKNG